ncbi:MAG: type II toxin-antitoxin system RelE/ParE family toxin [Burkholderiaceae bacterium]
MVFIELTPFVAFRTEYWNDDDLRALQGYLLASPDAGNLIRGASGLRKLRWSVPGRGKRGGARVIYYWHVPGERIYLIYGYAKNVQSDLTVQQIKTLAALMEDVKHG